MFNKNIYWGNGEISSIANRWSWKCDIFFNGDDEDDYVKLEWSQILRNRIYSIDSLPTKEMKVINTYQGGIRMTHPGRVYYNGVLEFSFNEDTDFNVTKIFYRTLNSRFSNLTIMDENYPYKDSDIEIDRIYISLFDPTDGRMWHSFTFFGCWVNSFEYLNNLENKNEEENLKCKASITYNYYVIDDTLRYT